MTLPDAFDLDAYVRRLTACCDCPRLAGFLDELRAAQLGYFARPVPPFGATDARLVIVGLAPGMHGANRTGRPFTGDYAGILLYETLHRFGFASRPVSESADDGLRLIDCLLTNAVKCLPPQNKPETNEVWRCNRHLREVARVVMNAALEGDMQAANMVLQRLSPPLRARAEKVTFDLTPDAPLHQQANQVLASVAEGAIDPETGKMLIDCIQSVAGIRAVDELEARLIALEEKQA